MHGGLVFFVVSMCVQYYPIDEFHNHHEVLLVDGPVSMLRHSKNVRSPIY